VRERPFRRLSRREGERPAPSLPEPLVSNRSISKRRPACPPSVVTLVGRRLVLATGSASGGGCLAVSSCSPSSRVDPATDHHRRPDPQAASGMARRARSCSCRRSARRRVWDRPCRCARRGSDRPRPFTRSWPRARARDPHHPRSRRPGGRVRLSALLVPSRCTAHPSGRGNHVPHLQRWHLLHPSVEG